MYILQVSIMIDINIKIIRIGEVGYCVTEKNAFIKEMVNCSVD